MNVIDEPLSQRLAKVYGATFIRLDEGTILKLRTPLDSGFEEVEKKPKLPELPGIDGMPLPPLPDGNCHCLHCLTQAMRRCNGYKWMKIALILNSLATSAYFFP